MIPGGVIMYPRLLSVEALPDYQLLLTYENEERRRFAMKPYLDRGVFAELKDENLFQSVRVCYDTIEWSNGADLCPEVLYAQSRPQVADDSQMDHQKT
jgi:hypothetical protein